MKDQDLPTIGSGKESGAPVANFLKKEKVDIPAPVMRDALVVVPRIYYWEEVVNKKSVLMTMAFVWHGRNFGYSYPMEEGITDGQIEILRKQLFARVKETLDVLVHHGESILDSFGNIDPRKVLDQEAIRYKYDPLWDKRVAAFNKVVRVYPITRAKAIKLGLLGKSQKK